jgi:D-alanyl-D-alanine carboxypeptidase
MSQQQASPWRRVAIAGLLASLTIVGFAWDGVEAGAPRRDPQSVRQTADKHVVHGPNYHPPYSAIVIDDNSGQVLHDENADEPRHPASLTKIMTLYLLFEQLRQENSSSTHRYRSRPSPPCNHPQNSVSRPIRRSRSRTRLRAL